MYIEGDLKNSKNLESTGHGVAAIGLTPKNFPTNKQPGFVSIFS
jgi:hypothetical protein